MIAYLKGTVAEKHPDWVVIDVNGIGYEVEISTQTFERISSSGNDIKLLIHHHMTDNDQRLFGFSSTEEKELFELLITVKGVGPKLGLTILSGLPALQITGAIARGDTGILSQISGIGKKTAERMVLELKDKISDISEEIAVVPSLPGSMREEALSALESLGFRKRDAEKAITSALKGDGQPSSVQQLVKQALAGAKR